MKFKWDQGQKYVPIPMELGKSTPADLKHFKRLCLRYHQIFLAEFSDTLAPPCWEVPLAMAQQKYNQNPIEKNSINEENLENAGSPRHFILMDNRSVHRKPYIM
eukprot:TRINITY_DN3419_c0_g1_i1.p11 TRINITY_DN3419_c0_g1~~TRINITY_DN3419_c0_g1_i1.p11  ORF type:complete len:104 (-),score=0.65 TRINITY_DN3419_c0_g1_i1:81-392(-)